MAPYIVSLQALRHSLLRREQTFILYSWLLLACLGGLLRCIFFHLPYHNVVFVASWCDLDKHAVDFTLKRYVSSIAKEQTRRYFTVLLTALLQPAELWKYVIQRHFAALSITTFLLKHALRLLESYACLL